MSFHLVTSVGQRKNSESPSWVRNRTSDLRIPRSDALPLSHRDSTVSEVYYEVHMTRVLHTARISNIDSVMFVVEIRETQQLYSTGRTEHFRFKFLISSQARFKWSSLGCPWVRKGRGGRENVLILSTLDRHENL